MTTWLAFRDIEGKLAMLRVECTRCRRVGRYNVAKLSETYGRDGSMADCRRSLKQARRAKGGVRTEARFMGWSERLRTDDNIAGVRR
jgi:hypothetical protein